MAGRSPTTTTTTTTKPDDLVCLFLVVVLLPELPCGILLFVRFSGLYVRITLSLPLPRPPLLPPLPLTPLELLLPQPLATPRPSFCRHSLHPVPPALTPRNTHSCTSSRPAQHLHHPRVFFPPPVHLLFRPPHRNTSPLPSPAIVPVLPPPMLAQRTRGTSSAATVC